MLVFTRFEMPFEMQDSLVKLRVVNLLSLNEIDKQDFAGLLSILNRLVKIEEEYYEVTRPGLIEINTQRSM
jgi:hypothetical protein